MFSRPNQDKDNLGGHQELNSNEEKWNFLEINQDEACTIRHKPEQKKLVLNKLLQELRMKKNESQPTQIYWLMKEFKEIG